MTSPSFVEWSLQDGIGVLALANPPQNAVEEPEFVPLPLLRQWTGAASLRGVVVTGKGRHFSVGANTQRVFHELTGADALGEQLRRGRAVLDHLEDLPVPVVAAVRGTCFGAGFEVALACHHRVCAENALMAFPEVMHGLLPGLGGTVRLPRTLGAGRALEVILSGRIVNAGEARELGIADRVVPKQETLSAAVQLARSASEGRG